MLHNRPSSVFRFQLVEGLGILSIRGFPVCVCVCISCVYRLLCKVMAREVSSDESSRKSITLEQLFSHRVHGVDNTGNVKVWPAEQALLRVLLSR